jgi:hypothetical protein
MLFCSHTHSVPTIRCTQSENVLLLSNIDLYSYIPIDLINKFEDLKKEVNLTAFKAIADLGKHAANSAFWFNIRMVRITRLIK